MAADPLAAPAPVLLPRQTPVLPAVLAGGVVALQIAYPLVQGSRRDVLSALIVLVFAAAAITHAAATRGVRFAAGLLGVTAVAGYAIEVIGVHTGVPFGVYSYGTSLGPQVLGVPPVVALAWTMLAWPAAIAARHLVRGRVARIVVGGWALAVTDLFLDPQMVAAGHWHWADPGPHLPGVPDVPLTNFAGWLIVALGMSAAIQAMLANPSSAGDVGVDIAVDAVPVALYLWLFVGWIVALGVLLDLRAAAAWGALGMGSVAVPLASRAVRLRAAR